MPKPKDIVSAEAPGKTNAPPSTAKKFANVLRDPLTRLARSVANQMTFEMKSRTNANIPNLHTTSGGVVNGRLVQNRSQLNLDTFNFTPSDGGKTRTIEGFHLPAQPGKPTVVFFGGSNFDRNAPGYQTAIQNMAYEAKQKGMGFAAYDYPPGATEGRIKEWVAGVQNHLENNLGVPKNQQAYSGYSLGSFSAAHAANINPQASGLHILSGFSSARMAQKEGLGPAGVLVDMSRLNTLMDTAKESRDIRARLGPDRGDGTQMPISVAYSNSEGFGQAGNRHMKPVIDELGDLQGQGVKVTINTAGTDHLDMLNSPEMSTSFQTFVQDTEAFSNTRQQALALNNVPVVNQVQPVVNQPTVANNTVTNAQTGNDLQNRPLGRSNSVRSLLKNEGEGGTSKTVKRSQSMSDLSNPQKTEKLREKFQRTAPKKDLSQSQRFTV